MNPKPIVFNIFTEFSNPLMRIVSNEYLDSILSRYMSFRLLFIQLRSKMFQGILVNFSNLFFQRQITQLECTRMVIPSMHVPDLLQKNNVICNQQSSQRK